MYTVRKIDRKGDGIVARSPVDFGTTVLRDDPFEAVLDSQAASKLSHWSFKFSKSLQRCVGCKFAWYSDRKEQKLAWVHGHKEECKALQRQGENLPGQSVRLMARILWKRARLGDEASFVAVRRLVTHWEDLSDQQKITYANAAHATRSYMDPEERDENLPSRKEIAQLFSMLACNAHTICDDEEHPIGLGLYPLGALVNHSSTPNAVQVFLGNEIHFRALGKIPPGEEVTIAYIELGQIREEQREVVLERYHFDINQGRVAPNQKPQGQRHGSSISQPYLCRVWQHPPFHMNQADDALTAVSSRQGSCQGRNGFCIQAPCGNATSWSSASFPLEEDKLQSKDDLGSPSTEAKSNHGDDRDHFTSANEASNQQNSLLLDCWGPIFFKDEDICWELVEDLAAKGLVWYSAIDKANAACKAQKPFSLEDVDHALHSSALHARNCHDNSMRVELGPLHVLRARLNEVRFRIAQQTGHWQEALRCGLELQPYYETVYPQAYPLRGLHEAAVAKIADLLQQPSLALQSAQTAFNILVKIRPENACLADLRHIQFNASIAS